MANKEQLAILKQGVRVWNEWREHNVNAKIDLNAADLAHANLSYANLKNAKLSGVAFDEADLIGADLRGANLRGAYLVSAKIDKAKVSKTWIHAVNVWDLEGEFDEQEDLIITRKAFLAKGKS